LDSTPTPSDFIDLKRADYRFAIPDKKLNSEIANSVHVHILK